MGRRSRQRASASPSASPAAPSPADVDGRAPRREEAGRAPRREEAGRRSGRRGGSARPSPHPPARRRDAAPEPPWGSFPLVELAALAAIVCGAIGLITGGRGGGVLLTVAMLLGSLAGLEVAIREHLAGYRSHTLVLSGVLAVATLALLAFAGVDRELMAIVAAAVLAGAIVALRELFKRRSGGIGIKVR